MTKSNIFAGKLRLLATAAPFAMILGATPAFAQDAPAAPAAAPTAQAEDGQASDIVVTGSLFRRTDTATPSPVTVVTTDEMDKRGINTVQDAIQTLSSNNGPALTNSFTANGAFAGGASSVSLRGLSTNSTLVLFDGLRAAYYPLADDGSRNFVDLNTVPDDIVDRIEVLRDGASSSYGADAIAGVVNIITKRSFTGVSGRAEAGISEDGVGANQRLTLTAGVGDLDEKGFNAYVSGFFYHSDGVYNRDLPAPYNSDNLTGICSSRTGALNCGPDGRVNGLDHGTFPNLGFGVGAATLFVRPYDATNTTAQGRYQFLNSSAGCRVGDPYNPSPAELAASNNASVPTTLCLQDTTNLYAPVTPTIERFGASARFTAKVGDSSEAYLMVNFQQTTSGYTAFPAGIRANANTGIRYPRFSTAAAGGVNAPGSGILTLPVWVCPQGVGSANGLGTGCTAQNGTLNPNNPFAASGRVARIVGALSDTLTSNETRSRVYRAAFGIKGTVFGDWDYKFDATAMHTDLRLRTNGYVYIQHLLDVIAQGTYNFVNPELNSAAIRNYLSPEHITHDSSDLYQAQLSVSKALFDLPGGPLQLGLGASVFYEAVDAPSANDDYNGPTQRYFVLNAFGTKGNRTVSSGFFEVNAPIVDQFEVNVSGRYDHYSSGQSAFSPKVGAKFTPIKQVAIRGTYSRGFRIPSFGEANALPTTGFVSQSVGAIPQNFRALYGARCGLATNDPQFLCPTYLTTYSIGSTTLASPNLKPEKSRSFTAGILVEPIRNVSFTVDYYNIRKTGAITQPSNAPAVAAYYAGQPIPAGYNVIADAPLVGFENVRPRIGFIESQLINANTIKSEGIDFGMNVKHDFGGVTLTSNLDASLILELSTTFEDGTRETYVDTLGNFNLTAGTGTFRWRGTWQNTIESGPWSLTGTANYTSGYDLSAMDQGDAYGDCGEAPAYVPCRVKSYFTFDVAASVKVSDQFTFYANVINIAGRRPPLDVVTYGAFNYNAVQGGNGILGRQFRAGAKFNF